jgi:cell division protein FtsI (penicillin-binding protein 3)
MHYTVSKWIKVRTGIILFAFYLAAAGILARAYQMQVQKAGCLKEAAAGQYRHLEKIIPSRGIVHDRQGNPLAVSRKAFSVYARPEGIKDIKKASRSLSRILEVDEAHIREKLASQDKFVWIARQVPVEVREKIGILEMTGIGLIEDSKRLYTSGTLAAQVIGFAGVDSQGLEGIEYAYDGMLRGQPRFIMVEQDGRGEPIQTFPEPGEESKGSDLVLTLDKAIQFLAERELKKAVASYKAKHAGAIVMEPRSGRILAMAMEPGFDPNRFQDYPTKQWRNWLVTDIFEPGSTFKIFMAAAAMEEGIAEKNEKFFCEYGAYAIGQETINDVKKHGWLDLEKIVTYSSNIGAAKLGEKLGPERMYEYIQGFGFGERTGLDFPGETRGIVREPKTWSRIAVDTIAFGQGISVTALQMVTALSAIANGGELMKPYIAEKAIRPDGTIISLHRPERVRRVISKKTARELTEILCSVVSPKGTGSKAAIEGYKVAGKTGTAQKPKSGERGYEEGKYICSFMGFAPAYEPRLAVIVVIDEPRTSYAYGGTLAAPVFREIVRQALIHLNVTPESSEVSKIARIENQSQESEEDMHIQQFLEEVTEKDLELIKINTPKKGNLPDLKGKTMRQVLLVMQGKGVEIQFLGSGVAVDQNPAPGTPLKDIKICRVKFKTPEQDEQVK